MKTVQENCEGFTKRAIKDVYQAIYACNMVGLPSAADVKHMVRGDMLKNSLIFIVDIKNYHTMVGPDVRSLRQNSKAEDGRQKQ